MSKSLFTAIPPLYTNTTRYHLRTPDGYVTGMRGGRFLGYTQDVRCAGAFVKGQLERFQDDAMRGIIDIVACDGSDKKPKYV